MRSISPRPLSAAMLLALVGSSIPLSAVQAKVEPLPFTASSVAQSARPSSDGRYAFYVRYKNNRRATAEDSIKGAGGNVTHRLDEVRSVAVLLPAVAAEAILNQVRAGTHADFDLIELVPEHKINAQVVPWNVDQFQARDVWDKNRDGVVDTGAPNGSGIKFCIIDTGFYAAHDDFQGITHSGISQITGELYTEDGNGHGTHVAGTANAMNNSFGVVGVMPGGMNLHLVKIFNNSGVWVTGQSNLGSAATNCRTSGANVLSMSLGGGSSATEEAVFQANYDTHGILNVAAAGNDGDATNSYPANYESVVSVGALDQTELAASFTQFPPTIYNPVSPPANVEWDVTELSGGGANVLSTWPGPPAGPHGGVPDYRVINNAITYSSNHIEASGITPAAGVTANLVNGGLCDALNAAAYTGKVVLCQRGTVTFAAKVNNVANSGGLAAIIFNNVAGNFNGTCLDASSVDQCPNNTVPGVSISQADGQFLLANRLNTSTTVIADNGTSCTTCIGGYNTISGTSMATPGVAAGMGFVWNACGGPSGITNKQLRQLLRDSAKDLSGTQPVTGQVYGAGWDRVTGWGLIQLEDAMRLGHTRFGSTCPLLLNVSPASREICTLSTSSTTFTATLDDQFLGTATLSSAGVPAGASGSFSPNPITHPSKVSTFTLNNLGSAAAGNHAITLTATDNASATNTASGGVTLRLVNAVPGASTLATPANNAQNVSTLPTLTWNAVSGASSYLLQVATDAAFSNIVHSATVTGTSHNVTTLLNAGTQYFWRVTAINLCGNGAVSTSFSFTTSLLICNTTAAAIPDNNATGVNSTINIPTNASILDLDVSTAITHTQVGDLIVTLTKGSSVIVIDRPGYTGTGTGCSGDNIDTTLDDEAATLVEAQCAGTAPSISGTHRPNNALNGFDGQNINGTWTLNVRDARNNNTGTLTSWCLIPTLGTINLPAVANDDSASVAEDTGATAINVLANDTDPETDPFVITAVTQPANGTVVITGGGTGLTYQPNPNFCNNGSPTSNFTYTVTGGDTATVAMTVTCTNDSPDAVNDAVSVLFNSSNNAINVLVNDTAAPDSGETLTITAVTQSANGSVSFTASSVSFTPTTGFTGPTSFTYTISDGNGGSDTATVSVTVGGNNPPTANNDSLTVSEDSGATTVNVLANDTTAPDTGETLTITAVTQPANGSASFTASSVSFTPNGNFSGSTSFTYTISDGNGGNATATVNVTVNPLNDPPSAANDAVTVNEDSGATAISVLLNDSFAPDTGETLTITAVTQPANGSVSFTASNVSFTPNGNFNGSTSFTYTISDGNGGSASATVNVTVNPLNDPPSASNDDVTVNEDSGATAINVLANDTTAPDTGESLTITAVTQPANGSVSFTASNVSFTPNGNFNGSTSFTYSISDGNGGSASATVNVTVNAVNDNPTATADSAVVLQNSGATTIDVLSNDSFAPDASETLQVTAVTQPANGSASFTGSNVSFTPNTGFTGSTNFDYTISDGNGGTATATVTINVLGDAIFSHGFEN